MIGYRQYLGATASLRGPSISRMLCASAAALALALGLPANADTYEQDANDTGAVSSIIDGDNWPGDLAPSGGNDYVNSLYVTQTPQTSETFAGDSLTVSADGVLLLTTPGVATTISDLTLNGTGAGSAAATPGNFILNGGLNLLGVTRLNARDADSTITVNSELTGSGSLNIFGPGTVVLNSTTSTHTGLTRVRNGGILLQGQDNAFSASSVVFVVDSGGLLQTGGFATAIKGLQGAGVVENGSDTSASQLTIGSTGADRQFDGTLQDGGDASLSLVKTGTNVQTLAGANTYSGGTTITDGAIALTGAGNLGTGGVTITGGDSGSLQLNSSNLSANAIQLDGRADSDLTSATPHIENVSGSSTVGAITLANDQANTIDPDNYYLNAAGGVLTVSQITAAGDTNSPELELYGDGSGIVEGAITMNVADSRVNKSGGGVWSANGAISASELNVNAGTMDLNGAAGDYGAVSSFNVAENAILDADDVAGDFSLAGQTLSGAGTVAGNVIAGAGADVYVGSAAGGDVPATLTFSGAAVTFGLDSILHIDIGASEGADQLAVLGTLNIIDGAALEFATSGILDSPAIVFASYGDWNGIEFQPLNLPSGYQLNYDYEGTKSIALVYNPAPAPGVLALMGIGALMMGGIRGRRKI